MRVSLPAEHDQPAGHRLEPVWGCCVATRWRFPAWCSARNLVSPLRSDRSRESDRFGGLPPGDSLVLVRGTALCLFQQRTNLDPKGGEGFLFIGR